MEKISSKKEVHVSKSYRWNNDMPIYTVQDTETGKKIKFEWNGQEPPTEQDMAEIVGTVRGEREPHGVSGDFSQTSWQDVPGQAFKNIPQSTAQAVKDIVTPVMHPIETAKALGSIAIGGVEKLIPGKQKDESAYDSLIQMLDNRYGNTEAIKQTLSKDPVGALTDIASALQGGAGLVGKAGKIGKAGQVASKLGNAVDPMLLVGKGIEKTGKAIGRPASQILGVTTGVGGEPIKKALQGGKDFTDALRGKIDETDIAKNAMGALGEIKAERGTEYTSKLDEISKISKEIDISPVKGKLDSLLSEYNIARTPEGLDFSRSTLNRKAVGDIQDIVDTVDLWGSKAGDLTPKGLDILKRKLDDFYSESKNSSKFVTSLRNQVKDVLVKEVPEYADMTKGYAEVSGTIKEIEKALSLNNRSSLDTQMRKLLTTMKENPEYRRNLVSKLVEKSGKQIDSQIAGNLMNQWVPSGFLGRSLAAGQTFALIQYGDPLLYAALSATSPKIVGEFLNLIGKSAAVAKNVGKLPRKTMFQAGRAKEETE